MPARLHESTLERVLNHCLSLDPYAGPNLKDLHGKVIELSLADSGLSMRLRFSPSGVHLESANSDVEPDASISATAPELIKMAIELNQAKTGGGASVSVTGDIEVVQKLTTLMGELDIDWEEQLSRWMGDSVAHGIGQVARGIHRWVRQTAQVLWMDVSEYLAEETQMLAHAEDVTTYVEGVDEIRDDVERLMARVARLKASVTSE